VCRRYVHRDFTREMGPGVPAPSGEFWPWSCRCRACRKGATNVKQADVVEVLSQDVCVSVDSNDDDRCTICTVDSEHLVDNPVVVSSLFAFFVSKPPV
jgi:hypothetical protein